MLDVLKSGTIVQVDGLAGIHKGDLFRPAAWPGPRNLWQRAKDEPRRIDGHLTVSAPFERVELRQYS